MSFIEDFPRTSIYDKDLGWLIRQYKELNDNYEVLKDIYEIVQKQINDVTIEQLKKWLDEGTFDDILKTLIEELTTITITDTLPEEQSENSLYLTGDFKDNVNVNLLNSLYQNLYNYDLKINELLEENKFNVCTFNVVTENSQRYLGRYPQVVDDTMTLFTQKPVAIGTLNEVYNTLIQPFFDVYNVGTFKDSNFVTTITNLLPNVNYGEGTLSYFPLKDKKTYIYTNYNTEKQGFCRSVFTIKNIDIAFYSTHFNYVSTEVAKQQVQELFEQIDSNNDTYVIVAGDFNLDMREKETYFPQFVGAGYKFANGGKYDTYVTGGYIDEIMVSSNINILDSGIIKQYVNDYDHAYLWATLGV